MEKILHDWSTEIKLSPEEAEDICNLFKGEKCCAFLVADKDGFMCIKLSYPMNSHVFQRLEDETMNAKGRGSWEGCPWNDETEEVNNEKS